MYLISKGRSILQVTFLNWALSSSFRSADASESAAVREGLLLQLGRQRRRLRPVRRLVMTQHQRHTDAKIASISWSRHLSSTSNRTCSFWRNSIFRLSIVKAAKYFCVCLNRSQSTKNVFLLASRVFLNRLVLNFSVSWKRINVLDFFKKVCLQILVSSMVKLRGTL